MIPNGIGASLEVSLSVLVFVNGSRLGRSGDVMASQCWPHDTDFQCFGSVQRTRWSNEAPFMLFPTMFQLHGYHCATGTDAGEACCENRWTGVVLQLPWDFTIENPIVWINRQVEHGDREPNVSSQAKRARTNS